MKLRIFSLFLLLSLLLSPLRAAHPVEFPLVQSLGLFPFMDHGPFAESERLRLDLTLSESSVYMLADDMRVINDMETSSLLVRLQVPFAGGFFAEADFRAYRHWGGFLDHFIEDFHSALGLPDNARPALPRNRVLYRHPMGIERSGTQAGVSPLVLSAGWRGTLGGGGYVGGRLIVELPLEDRVGLSSGQVAWGGGLLGGWRGRGVELALAGEMLFLNQPGWWVGPLRETMWCLRAQALLWNHWVLGLTHRSSPVPEGDLGNSGHQIFVGYRFSNGWELGLNEDWITFDTTPDITFSLRIPLAGRPGL